MHGGVSPATGYRFEGLGYATEGQHNPLLRDGTLRTSIEFTIHGHEAQIGSNSDYVAVQELGWSENNQPPRSVLGMAGFKSEPKVREIFAEAVLASFKL